MPNKPKLSLLEAFEILNLDPGNLDIPYSHMKAPTFYDPYDKSGVYFPDPLSPLRRDNAYGRKGYATRKPDSTYSEKFKPFTDLKNLQDTEARMPQYDGVPKKEKNRAKLSEALLPFIGSILPF